MAEDLSDDIAAGSIAFEAGQLLLSLRELAAASGPSSGPSADVRSDELITSRILAGFPGDAILSEEATDDRGRLGSERVWIVDPLDGTREFGEPPRDDWAVHVALLEGGRLRAGAVALPAKGMLLTTAARYPAPPRADLPMRLAVSRTRPPAEAEALSEVLGAVLVPMGSAGAKAMAVVRGDLDGYVHSGGQYEWDSAAPVAVAARNGLHASRLDGSPFSWNQPSPWLPDLLICRPDYADRILTALGDLS